MLKMAINLVKRYRNNLVTTINLHNIHSRVPIDPLLLFKRFVKVHYFVLKQYRKKIEINNKALIFL